MSESVRAMTFNVRYDEPEDGEHAWSRRRDAVASTIRFHDPHLVGLQEPLPSQMTDLRDRLPAYEWVGKPRDDGELRGEYAAIGYRPDSFELVDADTFWLSETPEVPGSRGWDAVCPRIATWARLHHRPSGLGLVHCNTHFDHRGERARRESAKLVARRLGDVADEPVVLTGDLNCLAGDPAYRILTGAGRAPGAAPATGIELADAMELATHGHHGPRTTRTDFTTLEPDRRVDHVLVSEDLAVRQHGCCTDLRPSGDFPSDHLPVLVELLASG